MTGRGPRNVTAFGISPSTLGHSRIPAAARRSLVRSVTGPTGGPVPVAPPGLPRLARGRHLQPHHGSCLMEYVSVLAGLDFSDHPRCTHPLLGWLARRVNDAVSDAARPQLVAVAPALVGTRVCQGVVRAVVYGQIARAGLAAGSGDPWLREFDRLTQRHLARLPGPSCEQHRVPTSRRWAQPLLTVDRNFAFGRLQDALDSTDSYQRDLLLLGVLIGSVRDCRRRLNLPVVPVDAHGPTRTVSVAASVGS